MRGIYAFRETAGQMATVTEFCTLAEFEDDDGLFSLLPSLEAVTEKYPVRHFSARQDIPNWDF